MTMLRGFASLAALALLCVALSSAASAQTPRKAPPLRPDLVIGGLHTVPDILPFVAGNQVQSGKAFLACFVVENVGLAASGNFRVQGSALGLPAAPFQDHAGLARGASRAGCVRYPTTPAPGGYKLVIRVDSLNAVAESNEANNTGAMDLVVLP